MDKRNYTIKEVDWQGIRKETAKIRHKIIRALSRNSIIKRKRVVKVCLSSKKVSKRAPKR